LGGLLELLGLLLPLLLLGRLDELAEREPLDELPLLGRLEPLEELGL
jgi:hypothetical protein